jgi:hypothetical protein
MDVKKHVPQIYWEQLYLNEITDKRAGIIQTPFSADILGSIEASNKEILDQYPPAFMKEEILRKLDFSEDKQNRKTVFRSGILRMAPIAAALIILTINLVYLDKSDPIENIIRSKGIEPVLSIYIDKNNSPSELFNNDLVSEADLIQLTYNSAGKRYGTIFSIDGRGVITLHHPVDRNSEPLIDPNGSHALPFAYELDDAPEFEKFFFISSNTNFRVDNILKSADKLIKKGGILKSEKLDISSDFDQQTIMLKKDL